MAPFNYIRNSVKVVMDAYDGSVGLYVMDPEDPVLAAYRRAFPELFRPLADLPAGLRAHLRYPQDLFQAQVTRYAAYHMRDPQVFYNNEDLWTVPLEKFGDTTVSDGAVLRPDAPAGRGAARVHADAADDAARQGQPDRLGGGAVGLSRLRRRS